MCKEDAQFGSQYSPTVDIKVEFPKKTGRHIAQNNIYLP